MFLSNTFSILTVTDLIDFSSNVYKRVLEVLITSVEGYYKSLRNCNSFPLVVLKTVLFYGSTTVSSLSFPFLMRNYLVIIYNIH